MPDIFDLLFRWWKRILTLVIITLIITAVFVFSKHKEYLGTTTALPAPTFAVDKSGVFSQNMQVLYPGLGSPDDLDMMLGTAHLDTVYNAVAEKLNLVEHYGEKKSGDEAIQKAGSILKDRTRVIKTDYGELKVKVWDADKNKAADMANGIMEKLQEIHTNVQAANNISMLQKINDILAQKKTDYQKLNDSLTLFEKGRNKIDDSYPQSGNNIRSNFFAIELTSLLQQIQEYEKLLNQYQLMVDAKPKALIITERATPPLEPDKPRPLQTLLAAFLLSFFFALLVAIVLERRRSIRK